jgi:hypothetical protein
LCFQRKARGAGPATQQKPATRTAAAPQSVTRALFSRVPLLSKIGDPLDRAALAAALLPHLRLVCHAKDAVVASHHDPADQLMVLVDGRIAMTRPRSRYLLTHQLSHL